MNYLEFSILPESNVAGGIECDKGIVLGEFGELVEVCKLECMVPNPTIVIYLTTSSCLYCTHYNAIL